MEGKSGIASDRYRCSLYLLQPTKLTATTTTARTGAINHGLKAACLLKCFLALKNAMAMAASTTTATTRRSTGAGKIEGEGITPRVANNASKNKRTADIPIRAAQAIPKPVSDAFSPGLWSMNLFMYSRQRLDRGMLRATYYIFHREAGTDAVAAGHLLPLGHCRAAADRSQASSTSRVGAEPGSRRTTGSWSLHGKLIHLSVRRQT